MSGECLHRLWREPRLNPTRNSEVSKPMPIESPRGHRDIPRVVLVRLFEREKEREELSLYKIVMSDVVSLSVRKNQVLWLLEF